jgi:transposase
MPTRDFIRSSKEAGSLKAACWDHIRRKFHGILAATASPTAAEAVRHIGEIYAVEKQVRGSSPEVRHEARHGRARPVMEDPHRWLDRILQNLSAKSDMAGAIRYARTRWTALTR